MGQKSDSGKQPRKRLLIGVVLVLLNIVAIIVVSLFLTHINCSYREFAFSIQESDHYLISEINCDGSINSNEYLKFNLQLKENVNNSNIEIMSTSGDVTFTTLSNGSYDVTISHIKNDFNVYISNITTNSYKVTIICDDDVHEQTYLHNEKLKLPNLQKTGYVLSHLIDDNGNCYYGDESISKDCTLYPVWDNAKFNLTFPVTDGTFAIMMDGKYISSNTVISANCDSVIDFQVKLSKAYCNSEIFVNLVANGEKIELSKLNDTYSVANLLCDAMIEIGGIKLNSYEIIVDGKTYGYVNYGSMLSIVGENIVVSDYTNGSVKVIEKVFDDDNFAGWFIDDHYVMNSFVQDIANDGMISIWGKYSKKWSLISLDTNGGDVEPKVLILVEGEEANLPTPSKDGYVFAGWFTKITEVNKLVDTTKSQKFVGITDEKMTLYAGWTK